MFNYNHYTLKILSKLVCTLLEHSQCSIKYWHYVLIEKHTMLKINMKNKEICKTDVSKYIS